VSLFRVLIFASAEPHRVKQLLKHLVDALPEAKLSLLYENPRRLPAVESPVRRALNFVSKASLIRSAVAGSAMRIRGAPIEILDHLLGWLHAAPKYPNPRTPTVDDLADYAASKGILFHLAEDSQSEAAMEFVRRAEPDLGVIHDARSRSAELFGIPTKGSIILRGDDDAGKGGVGRKQLPVTSSRAEHVISVYRVSDGVDSRAPLAERKLAIQEYDTPESIAIKSDLLGIECLVDAIRSESQGNTGEQPQGPPGLICEDGRRDLGRQVEPAICRNSRPFRPTYGRPLVKLLARFLFYPRAWFLNRRRAASQNFPVVILFGHVIADRPKFMGMSTDQFLKHLRFLKKHYRIASLPDAIAMLQSGKVHAPTVVLTFDDGYNDNHLGLRSVIDAEEIPVTLFVCTKNVQEHLPFDHDLKRGESGFLPLTWDQLKDFERQGSTIGSHTRTHFNCGAADQRVLRQEIVGAREDLQQHLGHDVPYFSFPWGYPRNMSPAALAIASETYPYLFAAYGGINDVSNAGSMPFKRVSWPDNLLELELTLQDILDFRHGETRPGADSRSEIGVDAEVAGSLPMRPQVPART
jgi:peptidoglycan/xylan/chitin deacetylase (PgdA/CDA1 family)